MTMVVKSLALVLAGLCEIGGGYLVWQTALPLTASTCWEPLSAQLALA